MPDLEPVGRVENPDELDLEPVRVPLVGYTLEGKEVSETFQFRPQVATGASLDVIRQTDAQGNTQLDAIFKYLDRSLLDDSERDAYNTFLNRDDVMIKAGALLDLYRALSSYYAARPTKLSSGSASTGSAAKRTSRAAARSRASTSRAKRSA